MGTSRWQAVIDVAVAVFADAVLLAFLAPKHLPDSRVLVQLDDELEVTGIDVQELDGIETITFGTLEELIDNISGPDEV